MDASQIVAMFMVLASLLLVTRGFKDHGLPLNHIVRMALIWILVILVGTFVISRVAS